MKRSGNHLLLLIICFNFCLLLTQFCLPQLLAILQDPLRFVLAAGTGTLFLVSLIVLRIYLVWIICVHESCGFWLAFLAKEFLYIELFENISSNFFIYVYCYRKQRSWTQHFWPNKASLTNNKIFPNREFLSKNYKSMLIFFIANIS